MSRRVLAAAMVLLNVGVLSSCTLLPTPVHDDDEQKARVQMQHIADAVEDHDPVALKKLFSPRAREKATNLDDGLKYFLASFPPGKMTFETEGTGMSGNSGSSKQVTELYGNYKVSVGGKKFELYFAYIPASDFDPQDVGIYALGAAPPSETGYTSSGARKPFDAWAGQFRIDEGTHTTVGDPGVYFPQN